MKTTPHISFALFIIVALATQKKWSGEERHDVNDHVFPDVIVKDLKEFKNSNDLIQRERINHLILMTHLK